MSKHTPGKWDVNQFRDLDGDFHVQVVLKSNGCPLAHMYECGSETKANALLISEAPNLLDLLGRYVRQDRIMGMTENGLYREACETLFKATGEQQ